MVRRSLTDHIRSALVVDALQMPPGAAVPRRSDRPRRPRQIMNVVGLRAPAGPGQGLLASMGRAASSLIDCMIESFWSTMERHLLGTCH